MLSLSIIAVTVITTSINAWLRKKKKKEEKIDFIDLIEIFKVVLYGNVILMGSVDNVDHYINLKL